MATVNVNRGVTDQFYRYKMPRIIAKVEGKGNGIKTVIVNMGDVAKALSRPPAYTTKFFGCELGAQTNIDPKNDRFIVNGSHDGNKLQELLDIFIKKFVLCQECDNPETNLHVQVKKSVIKQQCIACGHQAMVDMRHKLTTYILKNPPDADGNTLATPVKKEKKNKKGKKDSEADENDHQNGVQEKHSPPEIQVSTNDDDDDWGEDVSEEAVQARMKALTSAARNMTFSNDLEKTPQERIDMFYNFVQIKKTDNSVISGDKDILAEADRLDVKDKAPLILTELLLDENILSQLKTYRVLFLRFTNENQKAQKYMLGGIEQLVGTVHYATLMPKVVHIFKSLYDLDIIDEEVILEWGEKVSKKYVKKEISAEMHEKVAPFIKWLKEADEDSSEEEEDGVEVNFERGAKPGIVTIEEKKPVVAAQAEEEDDIDIDDI